LIKLKKLKNNPKAEKPRVLAQTNINSVKAQQQTAPEQETNGSGFVADTVNPDRQGHAT
jgi:hypothetical protein